MTDNSLVLSDWLETEHVLTPTEKRVIDTFAMRFGQWVPVSALARVVYRQAHVPELHHYEIHGVRNHLSRIRGKLERTPWRIENRYFYGLYRLVDREP